MNDNALEVFCEDDFNRLSKEVIKCLQIISSKKMHLDISTLSKVLMDNGLIKKMFDNKAVEAQKNVTELKYWKGLYLEHKNKSVETEKENSSREILMSKLLTIFDDLLHSPEKTEAIDELKSITKILKKNSDKDTINKCITSLNILTNKHNITGACAETKQKPTEKAAEPSSNMMTPLEVMAETKKDIFYRIIHKLSVLLPNVDRDIKSCMGQIENKYVMDDSSKYMDAIQAIIEKQLSFYDDEKDNLKSVLMMLLSELNETEKNVIFAFDTYSSKSENDLHFFDDMVKKVTDIKKTFNENDFKRNSEGDEIYFDDVVIKKSDLEDFTEITDYLEIIKNTVNNKVKDITNKVKDKVENDQTQSKTIVAELNSLKERIKRAYDEIVLHQERVKKQEESSYTDPLTGLLNKKMIDVRLKDEYNRFKDEGNPCSVLVCDLDKLRHINEKFGYSTGDSVLAKVAYILRKNLRTCDYVGRMSGEEFMAVLPDMDIDGAEKAAEKIRSIVNSSKFYFKEEKVDVALSFGVSQFVDKDNHNTVFKRAGRALYAAKSLGMNKVVARHVDEISASA